MSAAALPPAAPARAPSAMLPSGSSPAAQTTASRWLVVAATWELMQGCVKATCRSCSANPAGKQLRWLHRPVTGQCTAARSGASAAAVWAAAAAAEASAGTPPCRTAVLAVAMMRLKSAVPGAAAPSTCMGSASAAPAASPAAAAGSGLMPPPLLPLLVPANGLGCCCSVSGPTKAWQSTHWQPVGRMPSAQQERGRLKAN